MSKKTHCENCKWAVKQPLQGPNGEIQIGRNVFTCHRAPPTAIMVAGQDGIGRQTLSLVSQWPPVTRDGFCSMHEYGDGDGALLTGDVPGNLAG